MKEGIDDALFTFIDFIYAVVFALIVQQSFDTVIGEHKLPLPTIAARLLLLLAVFYFLAWDWILGRILTVRNPFQSYSRFFFEILIAAFAYGTAAAAIKGDISFLIYFAAVLFGGVVWAHQTERQIVCQRDRQELCVIQMLQFMGALITIAFYFSWPSKPDEEMPWSLVLLVSLNIWCFVFVYEMMVPRYRGISAGPGVPFLHRSDVRRIRKYLTAQ